MATFWPGAEENHRKRHQRKRPRRAPKPRGQTAIGYPQRRIQPFAEGQRQAAAHKVQPVQKPPCHKCPCRAVPQPAAQKNNHRVHTGTRQSPAAASQRDIQVISKKTGQADVPVAPELRHGLREERTAEIFHQFHAQNARRAPRKNKLKRSRCSVSPPCWPRQWRASIPTSPSPRCLCERRG